MYFDLYVIYLLLLCNSPARLILEEVDIDQKSKMLLHCTYSQFYGLGSSGLSHPLVIFSLSFCLCRPIVPYRYHHAISVTTYTQRNFGLILNSLL